MATQPIPPNDDIQARTARLKSRAFLSQPKKAISDKTILVHRCFSQIKGEPKPDHCGCKERVSYTDALAMAAKGEASWLLIRNPKTTALVKSKRAIVAETHRERFEEQTKRRRELDARLKVQAEILQKLRKFIVREFSKGNLPQAMLKISDLELRAYLGNPEHLRNRFPEFETKRLWEKVVEYSAEFWANHTNEPPSRDGFTPVTGGYGPAKIDTVASYDRDFASTMENLNLLSERVQAANFVSREFNGGYIGRGAGPDEFEGCEDD